jgi:hypothetical protein
MRKLLLVIASTAALVSCTTYNRMIGKASVPDPTMVQVYVVQGTTRAYIVVSQDPLVFVGNLGRVKIQWQLQDPNYQFDNKSISVTARPGIRNAVSDCNADGKGDSNFSCDDDTSVKGSFKYTITVKPRPGSGLRTPDPYDPQIMND